ncbi:antitoxin [Nocardia uniformis]|uniref:Antitoxin n=1 Tax=Nocardia uniformis TaxID=53432 RepID=A0A849C439_9NOCA|nr:antitoxin [Nocardia uniformis]NNH70537.1 antitoxin [Nocardia uniformis]
MGLFDQLKGVASKAADLGAQHADKLEPLVDKVGDLADQKTKGNYTGQIDRVQEAAKKALRETSRR